MPGKPLAKASFKSYREKYSLFLAPGFLSWKSCHRNKHLCLSWVEQGTGVLILETDVLVPYDGPNETPVEFVKVKVNVYKPGQDYIIGWVPSFTLKDFALYVPPKRQVAVKKQITKKEKLIKETREETKKEVVEEFNKKFQDSLIAFEFNRSIQHSHTLWSNVKKGGKQHEALNFMNFNVKFHLYAAYGKIESEGLSLNSILANNYDLTKDTLDMTYLGFGGTAPLFMDVEMGGSYRVGLVSNKEEDLDIGTLNKIIAHLSFMVPWLIDDTPVKLKAQGNLNLWNKASSSFLSKAYAIGEGGLSYEGRKFSFQILPGFVLNSDGIDLKNYNLKVEVGFRLLPSKGFDSPLLNFSFTKFHNSVEVNKILLQQDLMENAVNFRYDF